MVRRGKAKTRRLKRKDERKFARLFLINSGPLFAKSSRSARRAPALSRRTAREAPAANGQWSATPRRAQCAAPRRSPRSARPRWQRPSSAHIAENI